MVRIRFLSELCTYPALKVKWFQSVQYTSRWVQNHIFQCIVYTVWDLCTLILLRDIPKYTMHISLEARVIFVSLFLLFDSLCPINNLSVIKGQVFLGWTSTKLGLMFLLKETTQWHRWGSNLWPLRLESSTLPLSHCNPYICECIVHLSSCSQNKISKSTVH